MKDEQTGGVVYHCSFSTDDTPERHPVHTFAYHHEFVVLGAVAQPQVPRLQYPGAGPFRWRSVFGQSWGLRGQRGLVLHHALNVIESHADLCHLTNEELDAVAAFARKGESQSGGAWGDESPTCESRAQ